MTAEHVNSVRVFASHVAAVVGGTPWTRAWKKTGNIKTASSDSTPDRKSDPASAGQL